MSSSHFFVNKYDEELVLPSEPTPNHNLPLSWFDKVPMTASFMELYLVYKHGKEAAEVIKQALAKGLVPYYPLAGRIVRSEQGEVMHIACTGEGAWFIKAMANSRLEDMMGILVEECLPESFPREQLFPSHSNPGGMILMLQVTEFTCGGFVLGISYDHVIADGVGIAQIMKAIGDIARGFKRPLVEPVWLREHVPKPQSLIATPLSLPNSCPLQLIIDVPQGKINKLKEQYTKQKGKSCSTFDVVIAQLWQCRIRAIGFDPSVVVSLLFLVNTRNLLSRFLPNPLEGGYYGNSFYPVIVTAPSGKIAQLSIFEVVSLISEARKGLKDEFSRWAEGDLEAYRVTATMVGYESTIVSDWRHLRFSEINYGWGAPAYFAPVPPRVEMEYPPICSMIKPPTQLEGCRLVTRCVKKEHSEPFYSQMMNFSTTAKNFGGLRRPMGKL